LAQLAGKYGCNKKTIQRRLDSYKVAIKTVNARRIVLLIDTSYWGRRFGVMLFKDALSGENLFWNYVKHETNQLYLDGYNHLVKEGFIVLGIVCDGRKGLFQLFGKNPVQMCQFHQVAIVTRYLTRNPKTIAGKELRAHCLLLVRTDKESFAGGLESWYSRWKDYLDERTLDKNTGKSRFTHKKLRSAYNSLKRNLPYLFTWYDHIELQIPNTTNAIDGCFADLKNKLRCHNGLSDTRKQKFIDGFFQAS
jgi:hypothetical protein